jgi:hypothetical protein
MWKTLKSYFWWTHERGSFHYDVMVTLILLFLFLSPRFIPYRDKPVESGLPGNGSVVVTGDGDNGIVYLVPVTIMKYNGPSEQLRSEELQRVIEPISGDVSVQKVERVVDGGGHLVAYRAWVKH